MKNKERKKNRNTYHGKAQSALSRFALFTGFITVIIFIALVLSAVKGTMDEAAFPGLCFLDFLLSILGMAVSIKAMNEQSSSYIFSVLALVANTGMFIVLVCLYFIGL